MVYCIAQNVDIHGSLFYLFILFYLFRLIYLLIYSLSHIVSPSQCVLCAAALQQCLWR